MDEEADGGESLFGEREWSNEELQAEFIRFLKELCWTPVELADRMRNLGDYRPHKTILRGINRAVEGEVKVSGELMAFISQAVRFHRRLERTYWQLDWTTLGDNSLTTKIEGFTITLLPKSRGRWQVHLMHETGYSPSWPRWQDSLDAAKAMAFVTLDNGLNDLEEFAEAERVKSREEARKAGRIL